VLWIVGIAVARVVVIFRRRIAGGKQASAEPLGLRSRFSVVLLLPLGACALFEPTERRFVIFFQELSVQATEPAAGC
jgi:hypothetical protein